MRRLLIYVLGFVALFMGMTSLNDQRVLASAGGLPQVLAQFEIIEDDLFEDESESGLGWSLEIKSLIAVVATVLVLVLTYFAAYPILLRKTDYWPVTLFGYCTAWGWLVICLILIAIFWTDLVVEPADSFAKHYGIRILLLVIAIMISIVLTNLYRSRKPEST